MYLVTTCSALVYERWVHFSSYSWCPKIAVEQPTLRWSQAHPNQHQIIIFSILNTKLVHEIKHSKYIMEVHFFSLLRRHVNIEPDFCLCETQLAENTTKVIFSYILFWVAKKSQENLFKTGRKVTYTMRLDEHEINLNKMSLCG